nr:uncharacterized protein LOC117842687 isoform X1 [Setaria viridis]
MAEFLRHLRSLADSSTIPLPPPNSSCPEMRPFLGYILSPSSPSIIHQIDGNRSSPKVPGTFPPLAPPQCGAPPTSLPHRQPMPQMEPRPRNQGQGSNQNKSKSWKVQIKQGRLNFTTLADLPKGAPVMMEANLADRMYELLPIAEEEPSAELHQIEGGQDPSQASNDPQTNLVQEV